MSELTVASRYAKGLFDLAAENKLVAEIKNDMDLLHHTLRVNPELNAVLANPIVSHAKKVKILDQVFTSKVNKLTLDFFKLVINKSRGEVMYAVSAAYVNLYDALYHIVKATVVSATPLSEANKKTMIADIKAATGGEVKLTAKTDPSLIGGFVLTVGDRQVDTSIASDLKKLKKEFAQRGTN